MLGGAQRIRLAGMSSATGTRLCRSNHLAVPLSLRSARWLDLYLTVIINADRIRPSGRRNGPAFRWRAAGALALPFINSTERR